MRIYQPGQRGKMPYYLQPGQAFPVSQFQDEEGNAKLFTVIFVEGQAEVDEALGQYMIDQGIAQASPILLMR